MDDLNGDPLLLLWKAAADFFGCATNAPPRELLLKICHALLSTGHPLPPPLEDEAAARLAAAHADPYGLRLFWRLPATGIPPFSADPLRESDGLAAELAQRSYLQFRGTSHVAALEKAMSATANLAAILRENHCTDSAWDRVRPIHPLGFGAGESSVPCGNCCWFLASKDPLRGHCLHARLAGCRKTIAATTPSCNRFESPLCDDNCGTCGACCHRGFSLVPVLPGDRILKIRPDWIVRDTWGRHIPRPDGQCLALQGNGSSEALWRCRVYPDRPRHCRDFTTGSLACLEARRRAGVGP